MTPSFIHLNVHSQFSIMDGLARPKELIGRCVAQSMPAVALTDYMNLFGLIKFYREAMSAGIKPIIGVEICIESPQQAKQAFNALLLCQNSLGYKHLSELLSRAYQEGQDSGQPRLQFDWFQDKSDGLIVLSGAQRGDIGQALLAGQLDQANQYLQRWQQYFPDRFYIEIQRIGCADEIHYIQAALSLASQHDIPVVATNAVRFLRAEDFTAHEARVAIHDGFTLADARRPKKYTHEQYMRDNDEMLSLFADIPEALRNSVEIAKRCNLALELGTTALPDFPIPEHMTIDEFLRVESEAGLQQRLQQLNIPDGQRSSYFDRLAMELDIIIKMGFPGYFLIVADFIRWAKQQNISVGPGRGSGAGSLVAYALNITDLDPITYDLLFERFLNPERVSMPDFDIDFCMEGRDRVIDYVAQKYGRDSVSQIITYGSMAAKAVVRDVGRVLGHPYGFVDKIAKLIPFELGITLTKALKEKALKERYQQEEEVRDLIDLAKKLEGCVRNVGKHAGGVIIAPGALTHFMPIYCEPGETAIVSQFDKNDVEAVGLVKFDFLGLRTLTIIDWALDNIQKRSKQDKLDILKIPLDDEKTFSLLQACHTTAVFQLESRGIRDLIKRLQPDCFDDIKALVALFRPGPLQSGMVDDFIERKHGRAELTYLHPQLEPILRSTYGVILYQEQVMQIAQSLAGYTLGGADLLRGAMGKKKPEEMAKQRLVFVNGAVKRGIDQAIATHIFDLMEKFAGYGFNKAHSAAYALLAYQTAWLKTHYPAEFMAAVLSADMDNTDKIVILIHDCQIMEVKILTPNINQGYYRFTVNEEGNVVYGLGAIKGVGEAALTHIIVQREQGEFTHLFNFIQRLDLRKVNRRVLESLIKAGALDCFKEKRAVLYASLDRALQHAEQCSHRLSTGQTDLFGDGLAQIAVDYVRISPWTDKQRLAHEKATLGWYCTGHPLQHYTQEFASLTQDRVAQLRADSHRTVKLAGMVVAMRTMLNKRNERMAFISLDDGSGRIEIAVFSDVYQEYRGLLQKDALLFVQGVVSSDNFTGGVRMSADEILSLEQVRNRFAHGILLSATEQQLTASILQSIQRIMQPYQTSSGLPVFIEYQQTQAKAQLRLGSDWQLRPCEDLLDELSIILGENNVTIYYNS